ncbi:hypothetical protein CSKR_107980 [Clonorchis sinensis]|uniref:Uncharacterized protein n=1 Tax=Clonorchis sinensis TaxID=79923 RepID=A0A3R7F3J5_CLOSI|nr:hypothetical protein CSKR_107980 [Clonorchis sinensis]
MRRVLWITGSLSPQRRAFRQFFEDLQKAQKHAKGRLTTRELFLIDGVANAIADRTNLRLRPIYILPVSQCETQPISIADWRERASAALTAHMHAGKANRNLPTPPPSDCVALQIDTTKHRNAVESTQSSV